MVSIKTLNKLDKVKLKEISNLHKRAFPTFFLTQLGTSFLKTLYKGYIEDDNSGIIVAEDNGRIIGFVAYSNDYSKFYKCLLKSHLFEFGFFSLCAVVKHPTFAKRLLNAFKKSDSVKREERYVELASICVDPLVENHGIGSKLIDYLKSIVDFSEYAYINLETDAEDNDYANRFYKKNGFTLYRTFFTPESRKMNEYRWMKK